MAATASDLAISISSQRLVCDSGACATDDITRNGHVTLTGTVTGPAGTLVKIYDGATLLGTATVRANGSWSFATLLAAGSHSLSATAVAPSGNSAATAAEPTILVETALPSVTIAKVAQSYGTTSVGLSGTVAGAAGTVVKIYEDGATLLGTATLGANGSWSYSTGSLSVGHHWFRAVATDLAGNSAGVTTGATVDPGVTITSQTLADDTGSSASDNITSDGTVTLTGTVTGGTGTGGTGTIVKILNGSAVLGTAVITTTSSGASTWSFTTTLKAGSYALTATAIDTGIARATSSAAAAIQVETTAPTVTIATPVQTAGSSSVSLSGTVSGASGTIVQIYNGSTRLGQATVGSNGSWSYSAVLTSGQYDFEAVAVDLAGNTATASDAAFTVTSSSSASDVVQVTVSNGSGLSYENLDLSTVTASSGTYVATSSFGIGTNALVLYNWHPSTQLASFLAAEATGAGATIVVEGDSTSRGYGASSSGWTELSYASEMSQALNTDGVAAQFDSFLGEGNNGTSTDNRVSLIGGASYPWVIDAGGQVIQTSAAGEGFNFTLNSATNYDRVTISYVDIGSGSVTISIDGTVVGTMQFGNSGQTLSQTIDVPAGAHETLTVTANNGNATYIEGASCWSSSSGAIRVSDAAIGGWDTTNSNISVYDNTQVTGSTNGYGQTAGTAAQHANLVIVDLGVNDINGTNNGGVAVSVATIVANYAQIIASLKAAGSDVIIMIPEAFSTSAYATELPQLRTALEALAVADNVGLIDLSATYGDSYTALLDAGLMSDQLHPNATLYADIGSQIAALLASDVKSAASSGTEVSVGSSNSLSLGTAANLTALGNASADTVYVGAASQSVDAGTGTMTIYAAIAAATVVGNGQSTTTLYVTSAGTATLSSQDSELTIILTAGINNITLGTKGTITVDGGSSGTETITANAGEQTLVSWGATDKLIGYTGGGDIFSGSYANLSHDSITNFTSNDLIDITNLASSGASLSYAGNLLTVTSNGHAAVITLAGNYTSSSFSLSADSGSGTYVHFV